MGGGKKILNKNAFTLIELLAIIVILAIIAVITVPIILNIIENSRKGAATDSAYGYKDAINKTYVTELSKPNQEGLKLNGTYEVQSDGTLVPADGYSFGVTNYNTLPVSLSGEKPTSGTLTYSNNVLTSGTIVIGDYTVTYSNGSFAAVKTGAASNEQGSGGQAEEQENTIPQYVYSSDYENAHLTSVEDEYGSTEKPVTTNEGDGVYLRYRVVNDTLITPPDTCINDVSRTEKGELCLTYGAGNFENNTTLIKDFFNINDSEIVNGSYNNNGVECTFDSNESFCSGFNLGLSASSSGDVWANDYAYTFSCEVDSTSEYYCAGQ